jgi:hypothetical protein
MSSLGVFLCRLKESKAAYSSEYFHQNTREQEFSIPP